MKIWRKINCAAQKEKEAKSSESELDFFIPVVHLPQAGRGLRLRCAFAHIDWRRSPSYDGEKVFFYVFNWSFNPHTDFHLLLIREADNDAIGNASIRDENKVANWIFAPRRPSRITFRSHLINQTRLVDRNLARLIKHSMSSLARLCGENFESPFSNLSTWQ